MKINGILLGAGNSRRFSGNKLLYCINGKPMILNAVEKASQIPFHALYLVTRTENLPREIYDFPVKILENLQSEKGISTSIHRGLEEGEADGYFFMVCDQPFLSIESIGKVVEEFKKGGHSIICLKWKDKLGNPVIFSNQFKKELMDLTGDCGGKTVMMRHFQETGFVEARSEKELMDIDTKKSYYLLKD